MKSKAIGRSWPHASARRQTISSKAISANMRRSVEPPVPPVVRSQKSPEIQSQASPEIRPRERTERGRSKKQKMNRIRSQTMIRRAARSHEHVAADRSELEQRAIEYRPTDAVGQGAR